MIEFYGDMRSGTVSGTCQSGKRGFTSLKQLRKAHKCVSGRVIPYRCPHCGMLHVTSEAGYDGREKKGKRRSRR